MSPSGRVFVSGYTDGAFTGFINQGGLDGFVARFDGTGAPVATRQFGTAADDADPVAGVSTTMLASGAVLIGGSTEGALWGHTNAGGQDGYLMVLAVV